MIKRVLENIGEYWLLMLRVFERPERWRIFWRQYVNEAHKLIISSIPIVSIIFSLYWSRAGSADSL